MIVLEKCVTIHLVSSKKIDNTKTSFIICGQNGLSPLKHLSSFFSNIIEMDKNRNHPSKSTWLIFQSSSPALRMGSTGDLSLKWNPKNLEIKTRTVERTLEPLVMQVCFCICNRQHPAG